MDVGVNYPWFDYGWDFGEAPLGWRKASDPNWFAHVDNDLERFQGLGIRVVRWFILGDGLTYGTGRQAPHLDTNPRRTGQWRFDDPPVLGEAFQTHFRMLLERFEKANRIPLRPIMLLPVLIDFHFCQPGVWPTGREDKTLRQSLYNLEWVKGGRSDVIMDPQKRRRFFARVLEPMLRLSRDHRNIIYAWEVMNEPEWVTLGWHPDRKKKDLPVTAQNMTTFLKEGIQHIRTAGFKATVGFAKFDTISRSRVFADINQFHHYSRGDTRLVRQSFDRRWPSVIGEFATSSDQDTWPELESVGQHILNRLRYAESKGYPLVLPWSYKARDERTSWTSQIEQGIECFTLRRNCPKPAP